MDGWLLFLVVLQAAHSCGGERPAGALCVNSVAVAVDDLLAAFSPLFPLTDGGPLGIRDEVV